MSFFFGVAVAGDTFHIRICDVMAYLIIAMTLKYVIF